MSGVDETTFRAEVRAAGERVSLARANLLAAREICYPDLRPSDYLKQLDDLAAQAGRDLAGHAEAETRGRALADWLFAQQGFGGNEDDYNDPRNSFLSDVLDRRLGIPISLSAVYLELAARLALPAYGVGMPGHYIVAVVGEASPIYLDPFHAGRQLTTADCADLVRRSSGYQGAFDPRWLTPTPPRDTVARMLNNLRNSFVQSEHWAWAIRAVQRLVELQPDHPAHLRDLGLLEFRNGSMSLASELLGRYLITAPDAKDADEVRESRDLILDRLTRLN